MLIFRLLLAMAVACFRPRLRHWQTSVIKCRALPTDLDLNFHMNNARYSAFMDLGRLDLMTRMGLWRPLWQNRWRVVIASAGARFHRSIAPFEGFFLESRIVGWDKKAFYGVQLFRAKGRVRASGYFRGVFTAQGRGIAIADAAKRLEFLRTKPTKRQAKKLAGIKQRLKSWAAVEQTATQAARELPKPRLG